MNPFIKDTLREIARTKARFVSVMLITMLGAMLVVGIPASAIHKRNAADTQYRRYSLYDLQIRHPLGFDAAAIQTIRDSHENSWIEPTFIVDVYVPVGQNARTKRVYSVSDHINKLSVVEGRLPLTYNEIAVESRFMRESRLEIGDTLTLQPGENTPPVFITNEFTITGVVTSPLYITGDRGRTVLGDGTIRYSAFLHPSAFLLEKYTDIFIVNTDLQKLHQVSELYNNTVLSFRRDMEVFLFDQNIPGFVFTRQNGIAFDSYYADTLRLDSVARVFPLLFFLVAVLVCLTTVSRMVEEQRTQIGIYKALGYPSRVILFKYVLYGGLSAFVGGLAGAVLGAQILPRIIFHAYSHMYIMPPSNHPVPWGLALLAVGVSTGCIFVTVFITCLHSLTVEAAALMRPRAPKPGRRVWVERFPFLWRRLGFIGKVTARNLFRFKRRLFMTLTGVAGCTALLLTAFGLRDSIGSVSQRQYESIFLYDARVFTRDLSAIQEEELKTATPGEMVFIRTVSVDAHTEKGGFTATVIAADEKERLGDFISLTPARRSAPHTSGGVFVTEKLAREMQITTGDMFIITTPQGWSYPVHTAGIVKNYVQHYIYMDSLYYTATFNRAFTSNGFLLRGDTSISALRAHENVLGVSNTAAARTNLSQQTEALEIVTWVLLVMAGILAFVVLFNLTEINLIERRRELATIKVLGFGDMDTAIYLYRENLIVTLMGIALGLIGGIYLNRYILTTVEIDMMAFPQIINPTSFAIAVGLSVLFAFLVNLATYRKLTAIDMVESLKSVE